MSADEYVDEALGEEVEAESTVLEKSVLAPLAQFYKDSMELVTKSVKPDQKEYNMILTSTAIGLAVMGGLAYIIKLVHYPVKELLVGGGKLN